MATIAVFNQKGGVGKTTTALNLAASLAILERRPLAIDLDPQAHLTQSLGQESIDSKSGISAFYRKEKPISELVIDLPSGLRLVPSHPDLSKIDALSGKGGDIAGRLKAGLDDDFPMESHPIIIDCCPMLGILSLNAIIAANKVLIPVSADFLSMQSVQRVVALLRVLEGRYSRPFDFRIVVTRYDGRRKLSQQTIQKLRELYGEKVCRTRIGESVGLAESPAYGKDIFAHLPNGKGARDYFALSEELLESGFC